MIVASIKDRYRHHGRVPPDQRCLRLPVYAADIDLRRNAELPLHQPQAPGNYFGLDRLDCQFEQIFVP